MTKKSRNRTKSHPATSNAAHLRLANGAKGPTLPALPQPMQTPPQVELVVPSSQQLMSQLIANLVKDAVVRALPGGVPWDVNSSWMRNGVGFAVSVQTAKPMPAFDCQVAHAEAMDAAMFAIGTRADATSVRLNVVVRCGGFVDAPVAEAAPPPAPGTPPPVVMQ